MFINYYDPLTTGSNVETVEDCKGMTRGEVIAMLDNYKMVSPFYYLSSRATKQYYQDKKEGKKWLI